MPKFTRRERKGSAGSSAPAAAVQSLVLVVVSVTHTGRLLSRVTADRSRDPGLPQVLGPAQTAAQGGRPGAQEVERAPALRILLEGGDEGRFGGGEIGHPRAGAGLQLVQDPPGAVECRQGVPDRIRRGGFP